MVVNILVAEKHIFKIKDKVGYVASVIENCDKETVEVIVENINPITVI